MCSLKALPHPSITDCRHLQNKISEEHKVPCKDKCHLQAKTLKNELLLSSNKCLLTQVSWVLI